MKYEILTYTLFDGWNNCWTDTDVYGVENPTTFTSRKQAEKELKEFFDDIKDAVERGDMEEEYSSDDYRIVPFLRFNTFGWIPISWMEDDVRKEMKFDDYDEAISFVEELESKDLL